MDNVDDLLGGLASGDKVDSELSSAPLLEPLKRAHDSLDDFEHLERDGKRDDPADSTPQIQSKISSQNFLDMERDEAHGIISSVPVMDDHLADKFTDSESEGTTGESPIRRAEPPKATTLDLLHSLIGDESGPQVPARPPSTLPSQTPEPPKQAPELPKPAPEPPKQAPEPPKPAPEPPKQTPAPPTAAAVPARAAPAHVIEAEVIFCQMGLDAWFDPKRLHPKVESLIYWRDPVKSGIALGAGLAILVALACCSVVSVLAYVSLITLSAAVAFRIYKNVLQAVQKTNEGHPFKWLLDVDVTVPADRAQSVAATATAHLNATINELRRLFLVEDLIDSLKFGVLLWCLTYVGAYFNGITLIILGWIALFSLPKAYEMNKAQVDANLELARAKIDEITAKVRAAVPIGKKSESEKDK